MLLAVCLDGAYYCHCLLLNCFTEPGNKAPPSISVEIKVIMLTFKNYK